MQSSQDVNDIHEFFGGLERGSRFVVIPKRTLVDNCGWLDTPLRIYKHTPFDGRSALHLETSSEVVINQSLYQEYYDEGYEDGDEIESYYVHCVVTNNQHLYISPCAITATKNNVSGIWNYRIWYDNTYHRIMYYRRCNPRCDAISFVMKGGAQSLPAICAAACAERSKRVEKATFFALLARRFGDSLADKFTRETYPGNDTEFANHSLLDAA
jgi:hypothetical protein